MVNSGHLDAIVIGAGFAGIYMLKKLRDEQNMNVRLFDKAGGVGGTWYWNRYPGALSDTEAYLYCYSWDHDLLQDWDYQSRYIPQPQILDYLNHVVERHDLMRDIQLNTAVVSARFDEDTDLWEVHTSDGGIFRARFVVTALGLLSATNMPKIDGLDSFEGQWVHTSRWPDDIELEGKRVGVIGTGSTGNQVISAIASRVGHLTVFQRNAQYSVPAKNGPVDERYRAEKRSRYTEIWDQVRGSAIGFGFAESTVPAFSVSEAERKAVYQRAWDEGGGLRFMFQTFSDIVTDEAANETAAEFIKSKIREIVKDPETAEKLCPTEIYARRPLCDSGYYEAFNRENVALVDVKAHPIERITPRGIQTADGVEHELDVLIFATGFDAVDGNYKTLDIRGRGGVQIGDLWKDGSASYLGVSIANYPNLFMIMGPNSPFANIPPSIEAQVEWISDLVGYMKGRGLRLAEATQDAQEQYTALCETIASFTLFAKAESWLFGANIPGKSGAVMFYMGGLGEYRKLISDVERDDYKGYAFDRESPAGTLGNAASAC